MDPYPFNPKTPKVEFLCVEENGQDTISKEKGFHTLSISSLYDELFYMIRVPKINDI